VKKASLTETATSRENRTLENAVEGVWMIPGFANTGLVETKAGLVLIDIPGVRAVPGMMGMLRQKLSAPVHTIFLTHGHLDHAFSLDTMFEEAEKNGNPRPGVIAHRNVLKRLNRYRMLDKYHGYINRIQFAIPEDIPAFIPPRENPDITFDQSISLTVGETELHAFHEKGETDDALWVWVPEKKAVFAGDLVIMGMPNVGNPFKVQRYTLEWAEGLEAIVAKEPEVLVPGHSPLIVGKEKIRERLLTISKALRYLHDEVVKRLNAGMWYEDILHEVDLTDDMKNSEILAPIYGHPKFVVHGILRQYAGWYNGNPSDLFPPKKMDIYKEVASLIGQDKIIDKARMLKEEGRTAMALQFADMALASDLNPEEEKETHRLKGELLGIMGEHEPSFIARNIFNNGRNEEMKLAGLEE